MVFGVLYGIYNMKVNTYCHIYFVDNATWKQFFENLVFTILQMYVVFFYVQKTHFVTLILPRDCSIQVCLICSYCVYLPSTGSFKRIIPFSKKNIFSPQMGDNNCLGKRYNFLGHPVLWLYITVLLHILFVSSPL